MELTITRAQGDAVRGAKHLPDVLKRVIDAARPSGDGLVLHLTYEEATALQELCAWNVHMDAAGNVTAGSRIYDELVRAILTHPEYLQTVGRSDRKAKHESYVGVDGARRPTPFPISHSPPL